MLVAAMAAPLPAAAAAAPTKVALATVVRADASDERRELMANMLALLELAAARQPNLEIVERMEIDAALQELVLSQAVGEQDRRLQLGKLAAAEVIVTAKLLEPDDDGKRHVFVRATEALSARIRGVMIVPIAEASVDAATEEIANNLAVILGSSEPAGLRIAVLPFRSLGRFDRLRPLERGLRDMVAQRLLRYRQFYVLQRFDMKELIDELELARTGLSDAAELVGPPAERQATYVVRGTVDERHADDGLRLVVTAEALDATTQKIIGSIQFESRPEDLPRKLPAQVHRLAAFVARASRDGNLQLDAEPGYNEVDRLFEAAVDDLTLLARRNPRDFSHFNFGMPTADSRRRLRGLRVPAESVLGTSLLRTSVDRLESVLYIDPDRRDAAYALAFCLCYHLDWLWQPARADHLLRNIVQSDPEGPLAAAALDLLAEMYYHHVEGRLEKGNVSAARKQAHFAFANMPDNYRDYSWTRLLELIERIDAEQKDRDAQAQLMQLVAELAQEAGPQQQRLASHAARAAQSLLATARDRPDLQAAAQKLLDDWSASDTQWLRLSALQSRAQLAGRQRPADAAGLYQQAAEAAAGARFNHQRHAMLLRQASVLREAGDALEALELLRSFRPENRLPSNLLNGYYGVELGRTLEALGRKDEALETYVEYAESCSTLVYNTDVEDRIAALGGVPLRSDREIDVRYVDEPDGRPILGRALASDGATLYVGSARKAPVVAIDLLTERVTALKGPELPVTCLGHRAGELWVGTLDEGLWRCQLASGTWKNWRLADGLPDERVVDLAVSDEAVFVAVGAKTGGGLVEVGGEDRISVHEEPKAPRAPLRHLVVHQARLYGIDRMLYELDLGTGVWRQSFPSATGRPTGLTCLFAADGKLWGSAIGREIFDVHAEPEENRRYRHAWFEPQIDQKGYRIEFGFAREGQLWFGGPQWWPLKNAGFYRLDMQTGDFSTFGPREGFRIGPTLGGCFDGLAAGERIWIATSEGLAHVSVRDVADRGQ